MNEVTYSNYTFDDTSIVSGSLTLGNALAFDTLSADEMTVDVVSEDTGEKKLLTVNLEWYHTVDNRGYVLYSGDIREFTYGEPVYYYYNGTLIGKFYLVSVTRVDERVFRLSMLSAVGLMTNFQHMGGVYSGMYAGDVIDEIFNGKNLVYGTGTTGTSAGVTYTNNNDGTWTLNGTSTGTSNRAVGGGSSTFPAGMVAGGTYYLRIENGGGGVSAQVYRYIDGSSSLLVQTESETSFTIPEEATGCLVRFRTQSGTEVENRICSIKVTASRSNIAYTVDNDVAAVKMYGYLPIATARDNLQQVLFAIGASVMKDDDGNIKFSFLKSPKGWSVPRSAIFVGQKTEFRSPATQIDIVEHSYYKSAFDLEESLYDNTDGSGTAENTLVTFEEPHYDLTATSGLTINESGANFARVTGTGILSGKKYTHTTKPFSVPTEVVAETNIKKVEKATLVSPVNSANVAARLTDYFGKSEEVGFSRTMDTNLKLRPADKLTYTDQFGEEISGLIETMKITMSGKLKADCTLIRNYKPSHFGNNFTRSMLLTGASGTITFNHTGAVRVVLIGGGQGGSGGENGMDATCGEGASGGGGGNGGAGGKVFVTDIQVSSGDTFSYTTGAGGAGGAAGEEGSLGGDTTFGSLSSTYGEVPEEGYVNIMTGIVYALTGAQGIDGGNGGQPNESGENVTYGNTTWTGGVGCGGDGSYSGAGGGGAAYGANGEDATYNSGYRDHYNVGGDGANALTRSVTAKRGCGGVGGNGGGGGGAGGYEGSICWGGASGYGGTGSSGNAGGRGIIILYY